MTTCEPCGDDITRDEIGCECDGITRCLACLCAACIDRIRDDMAAEVADDMRGNL